MRSQTKIRIELTIISLICIFVVSYFLYGVWDAFWGPQVFPLGNVRIVDVNSQVKTSNQDLLYGLKIQKDSKLYLEIHKFGNPNNNPYRYMLTQKQYDKLTIGQLYSIQIKHYRSHIKKSDTIYTIDIYNQTQ